MVHGELLQLLNIVFTMCERKELIQQTTKAERIVTEPLFKFKSALFWAIPSVII